MTTGAPDYYKSILLYGLYDGAPVPLACDVQGRIIFVPGEVPPFQGVGVVLVRDTFGCGLTRVITDTGGTGSAVELDTTEAIEEGICCKLTGASDQYLSAGILYYYVPSAFTKMGAEWSARLGYYVDYYLIWLRWDTGTKRVQAKVRYHVLAEYWDVYDYATETWVTFLEDVAYQEVSHCFFGFKLTVDIPNLCYSLFKYPGGQIDLSQYALGEITVGGVPLAIAYFYVFSRTGKNGTLRLDRIILTQDES